MLQEAQLRNTAQDKSNRVKNLNETTSLLSERIRDTNSSQIAVDRMTNEVLSGIDELE